MTFEEKLLEIEHQKLEIEKSRLAIEKERLRLQNRPRQCVTYYYNPPSIMNRIEDWFY